MPTTSKPIFRVFANVTPDDRIEWCADVLNYGDPQGGNDLIRAQNQAYQIESLPDLIKSLEVLCNVIESDPRIYNLIGKDRYKAAREALSKAGVK